ncbi:RpiR family transcriptional regulator [Spiroplasma sabaudiense Ar-1343]|uniref:RpiR family transcriptional regulator n=1 Tax=Spiroplasma sabaudiense Ar-1343 TaxID=1276257 RepID=W6AAL8_9MOLU|nr:MurR/RpiR family transcriptional regulator [Spiroplasma sabaudiense]AHI54107.1 RpiR family transcriptional regulator [Spiroplasma sabaudiense Ar-1343]
MNVYDIISKIKEISQNPNDKKNYIAKTIMTNLNYINSFSLNKLAELSLTSPSSVTRFCKDLELDGYGGLRVVCEIYLTEKEQNRKVIFNNDDNFSQKLLHEITDVLTQNNNIIENSCYDIISKLVFETKTVVLVSTDATHNMSREFSQKMTTIGIPPVFIENNQQLEYFVKHSDDNFVFFFVCYGTDNTLISFANEIKNHKGKVVFITINSNINYRHNFDCVINIKDKDHPLWFNKSSSLFSLLFVFQNIFTTIVSSDKKRFMKFFE